MLLIEQMMMAGKIASVDTSVSGGLVSSATPAFLWTWGNNGYGQNGDSPRTAIKSWSAVSTKSAHTLAIRSDGGLFAWGLNSSGQLGTGDTINRDSPVQIGTSSWTAVSAGGSTSFAIRTDGVLFAWGQNQYYQLGDNSTVNKSSPVAVYGGGSWTSVSAGDDYFTAGIQSNGGLYIWGTDTNGQMGQGLIGGTYPYPIQLGTSSWTAVSAGKFHTIGIRSDGALFGWGQNYSGATGAISIAKSWTMISAGYDHTLGIQSDGTLWGWGKNYNGQIGDYTLPYSISTPVQVSTASWTAISAGCLWSLGIQSNGTLWGWGIAYYGNLGDNYLYNYIQNMGPQQLDFSYNQYGITYSRSWVAISAGTNHGLGIDTTGQLWGWGNNTYGQLGVGYGWGNNGFTSIPMSLGVDSFVTSISSKIKAGNKFSLVIPQDTTLWAFGRGDRGQLGIGDNNNYPSPVQVGSYSGWTAITTANYSVAGITNGYLLGWGDNMQYQLGQGNNYQIYSTPTGIPSAAGTFGGWTDVTGGGNGFLGVNASTLYAWGQENYDQLGSWENYLTSPVAVSSASASPSTIAIGERVSYYTNQYNLLYAAGYGSLTGTGILSNISNFTAIGGGGINTSSPVQVGTSSWTAVSTSAYHSLGIRADGKLFAWGKNNYGQLGDGSTTDYASPVQIGSNSWNKITSGRRSSLAIRSDGKLFAWGNSNYGQLGTGDTGMHSSPVQVGTSSWTVISTGQYTSNMIKTDGTLYVAGGEAGSGTMNNVPKGGYGNLGTITRGYSASPVQIGNNLAPTSAPSQLGTKSWVAISVGYNHSLGIRSDNKLYAWGKNYNGQLGDGTRIDKSSPVQIGTSSWAVVSAGFKRSFGITSARKLFAWGFNNVGLGTGANPYIDYSSPVQVGTSSWTAVSTDNDHTLAIRSDGGLFAWGYNSFGQLGTNNTTLYSSPVQIGTSSWTAVSTGRQHTIAIRSDGALFGWGGNPYGASGVQGPIYSWNAISTGSRHTLAIRSDSTLWSWGGGGLGQLGIGGQPYIQDSPAQIGTSSWTAVSAGDVHSLAIRSDGKLFAWGYNPYGSLGISNTGNSIITSPVQIGTSSWTSVSAGPSVSLGIRSDGTLWGWGRNNHAQVANGILYQNYTAPFQISTSSWSAITLGYYHAHAIRSDGKLFSWGSGYDGGLGLGGTTYTTSPIQVGTSSWTAISAGRAHSLGITSTGKLFGWGNNSHGQLGVGDVATRNSPIQVGTSSWTAVAASAFHSMGKLSNGNIAVWGQGTYGQNATNSDVDLLTPNVLSISGFTSFTAISSGFMTFANFALTSNGSLFVWGQNPYGKAGVGGTSDIRVPYLISGLPKSASSPVQIGTSSWTAISAGNFHTLAIRSGGSLFATGSNKNGQIGSSSTGGRQNGLTQIGTSSWTAISAGYNSSLAIKSGGTLWAWGSNADGKLGIGSTTNMNSPVQVGSGTFWQRISQGQLSSGAL